jgi:hypothetical protein
VTARLLAEEAGSAELFFAGHGALVPASGVSGQIAYLEAYRANVLELSEARLVLSVDAKGELTRRVVLIEPRPLLAFHIAMGADAVAAELAAQEHVDQ